MRTIVPTQDEALIRRLQAIAEETRLAILRLLAGGELCVCELQGKLGAAQSRLSFHLKKLKDAGLILDRPAGRWVYYRLAPEALEDLRAALDGLTPQPGAEWDADTGSCCGGDC